MLHLLVYAPTLLPTATPLLAPPLAAHDSAAFLQRLHSLPFDADTGASGADRVQAPAAPPSATTTDVHARLLQASGLLQDDGRVVLSRTDVELALEDLHLHEEQAILPQSLRTASDGWAAPDATSLVRDELLRVMETHPIFRAMAEQVLDDDFFASVYFGVEPRAAGESLSFEQLCRRMVASVYAMEELLALDRDAHRALAHKYEARLEASRAAHAERTRGLPARPARDALMGFFLALKGESVVASLNAFEMMRRAEAPRDVRALSRVMNAIMAVNIVEAVVSNLSFAFWPDNARAGMALLLVRPGAYGADQRQHLDFGWFSLYLGWNANFIWPSHFCPDMLCFAMLVAPTIALGPAAPATFGYNRAHSLFWVVRATQLSRMRAEAALAAAGAGRPEQTPCFRCKQLEPLDDRQPITSRTAVLTRAAGERLAAERGADVSGADVWWRLATEVLPRRARDASLLYQLMPRSSPLKLKLL